MDGGNERHVDNVLALPDDLVIEKLAQCDEKNNEDGDFEEAVFPAKELVVHAGFSLSEKEARKNCRLGKRRVKSENGSFGAKPRSAYLLRDACAAR